WLSCNFILMRISVSGSRLGGRARFGWQIVIGPVAVAAVAAACGSAGTPAQHDGPGAGSDAGSLAGEAGAPGSFITGDDGSSASVLATQLQFVPVSTALTVDGVTPQTTAFQLQATVNGQVMNVEPSSLQFDRPDIARATIGSPVSVTATGTYGGTATLHAIFCGLEAQATLAITGAPRDVGGVPAAIVTALDGAGTTRSDAAVSTIAYPYDKTVFPLGLTAPIVMWTAPTGGMHANDVSRLHFAEGSYTYDAYATTPLPATSPGPSAAQWAIPQGVWERVTASNAGTSDPLEVVLSRYDAATMTAAASASMTWTIAP